MKAEQKCEILVDLLNEYSPVDLRSKGRKGIGFRMMYGHILFNPKNLGNLLTCDISMTVAGKEINRDHSTLCFYKRESEYNLDYFKLNDLCDSIQKEFYMILSCGDTSLINDIKSLKKIRDKLTNDKNNIEDKLKKVSKKIDVLIKGKKAESQKKLTIKKYKEMNTFKAGKGKAVLEVDENGNEIQSFISVQEAADKLKLSYSMIRRCCNYDSSSHKGRFFVFESEFEGMFSLESGKK